MTTQPLLFGFDTGLTPACVMGQRLGNGQLRVLRTWATPDGTTQGMRQLLARQVLPGLAEFPRLLRRIAHTDVAASRRDSIRSRVRLKRGMKGAAREASRSTSKSSACMITAESVSSSAQSGGR